MSWKVSPEQFLGHGVTAEHETVPERPETIDAQVDQLKAGQRRAVMIPKGTSMPKGIRHAKHLKTIHVPNIGRFIFDRNHITEGEIRHAAKKNRLPEVLGAADGGMGVPDKSKLENPLEAVIGKDAKGTTTQGTLTDGAHLEAAIDQTRKLTPRGGAVSIESPAQEISNRMWKISPEQFLERRAS